MFVIDKCSFSNVLSCIWRYVSKHRPAVLLETRSNKHAMRTMGPAEVEVPSPYNYLKKHSKSTSPGSEFTSDLMDKCVLQSVTWYLFCLFVCFRDRVLQGGSSHLLPEEAPCSYQDKQPTDGHLQQEELPKSHLSCDTEAKTCMCRHQQGKQAAPGEFRTDPHVREQKGIHFSSNFHTRRNKSLPFNVSCIISRQC